ncbi:MAG: hypothetical protein WCR98_05755 [Saccharofermentanales bacterium]|jgi:hypothetical protein
MSNNSTRAITLQIHLTAEEREEIREAAAEKGLKMGPWIRMIVLKQAREQGR